MPTDLEKYICHIFCYKTEFLSSQNDPKNPDPSLGLFEKGQTCTIAKFHRTGRVICSYSREGKHVL